MQAIRNMELAWEKVQGGKFSLLQKIYQLPNGGTKLQLYYMLTKINMTITTSATGS